MESHIAQIAEELTIIRAMMAHMRDNVTNKGDIERILANRSIAKDGLIDVKHEDTRELKAIKEENNLLELQCRHVSKKLKQFKQELADERLKRKRTEEENKILREELAGRKETTKISGRNVNIIIRKCSPTQ